MLVILYSSDGCPYCDMSKKLFAEEIRKGEIIVIPAREVPDKLKSKIQGFPTFTKKSEDGIEDIIQVGHNKDKTDIIEYLHCTDKKEQKEEFTEKQEANKEDEKSGLSTVDIAGIVIASIAALALIIALGFLIAKAAKKGRKSRK